MRLFKRGRTWYATFYDDGQRVQRSTKCTDKKAAEIVARQWERDGADPDAAVRRTATLTDALKLLIDDRQEQATAGRRSQQTVEFYRRKIGHLTRVFEHDDAERYTPKLLATLKAYDVDRYISQRRAEGAAENTISKELTALRASLKLARRAGLWAGDPAAVCPIAFAPEYKPKERALSVEELRKLLPELTPDRAAAVAFMVATSAEWGAVGRAERADVDTTRQTVLVRGTKRTTRWRTVPLVSDLQRSLIRYVLEHAEGTDGALFTPWANVRRDLLDACERASIKPVSPNDLRRTCATWLRAAGAPPDLIAPVMGHADSRMVERVYGRLPTDALAARLASAIGQTDCSVFATDGGETDGFTGPIAQHASDPQTHETPENKTFSGVVTVPRDGIEPPTRGFSIPCSTD